MLFGGLSCRRLSSGGMLSVRVGVMYDMGVLLGLGILDWSIGDLPKGVKNDTKGANST